MSRHRKFNTRARCKNANVVRVLVRASTFISRSREVVYKNDSGPLSKLPVKIRNTPLVLEGAEHPPASIIAACIAYEW